MKTIATMLLLAASTIAVAQEPQTITPSATEKLAIQGVETEVNQAWADLTNFNTEVVKNHPGYHFNLQTGQIEKDAPKPAPTPSSQPTVAPAAKK